jgi:hypothetical protein
MKKLLFIFSLMFSMNSFANDAAAFYSGNEIHRRLNSSVLQDQAFASGYIMGVTDGFINTLKKERCDMKGVESQQIIDTVKKYFTDNPNSRQYTARSSIEVAFVRGFCR